MAKMTLDEHKRKIFIQKISPETTKSSLDEYFSQYATEWSAVPTDERGNNKKHGIVMFSDEKSVDDVMLQRFHRIDGKAVIIHRSLPMLLQSTKNNRCIQQLIVSSLNNQSLVQSKVTEYFARYGQINDMRMNGKTWIIDFDYYDSVARILLDSPHRIGRIDVNVEQGDWNEPRRQTPTPSLTSRAHIHNNNPGIFSKDSGSKQMTMNNQDAYHNRPKTKYCIHIMNLPGNIDAESLSNGFGWNIYNIVMKPSDNNRALSMECWLKDAKNEREIDDFVQYWNRKYIDESIIQCEKEEDKLELCDKFRFDQCSKSGNYCHWEHILCTSNGTCPSTCPYGHESGVKSPDSSSTDITRRNTNYRVKISNLQTPVTEEYLKQQFGPHYYDIDRKHDRVAYAVKILTRRFAKQVMAKWHNKTIDGRNISCQIELQSIAHRNRASSRVGSTNGESNQHRFNSPSGDANSEGTADFGNINNPECVTGRSFYEKDSNGFTQASPENLRQLVDTKYQLPSDVPRDKWDIINEAPNSNGKVLLIRNKEDSKDLAVIKIYTKEFSNNFQKEITIMEYLKDVKGVSKLIESENASNNFFQRHIKNDDRWMIMIRAPGKSLREFIEYDCQGVLQISTAIRLILNLIKILQQVHQKEIFHMNLSPENVMIDWNLKVPIDRAQLTVLNFNQAMIVSNRTYMPVTRSTAQKWYHAPQIDDQGMSSTVDPSGICAILFWLLIEIDPRYDTNELPHQQEHEKLNHVVKSAVKIEDINQQIAVEEQLQRYLMNTFDHAFGYPHYHPWTINDLACRLRSILQLLTPIEPELKTIDDIFQGLVSNSQWLPNSSTAVNNVQGDVFAKASAAFSQSKKYFLEQRPNQYEWSDGDCTWVHDPHSSINERYHNDILTYHSVRGKTTTSHPVIITCWASCSEEGGVMTLSMSSNVNGKTIRMPIGQYSTAQDYANKVQENFTEELKNLLLAIYTERKEIQ